MYFWKQHGLGVDSPSESGQSDSDLSKRSGARRAFKNSVVAWARKNAVIYTGNPPLEVEQWRNSVAALLWVNGPQSIADARRNPLALLYLASLNPKP